VGFLSPYKVSEITRVISPNSHVLAHHNCSVYVLDGEKLGQRRHRSLIVAEMLRIAQTGVLKSHLMYKVQLNHTKLEAYLDLVLRNNLLRILKTGANNLYKTTPKGLEYMQEYKTITKILNNSDLEQQI